MAAIGSVVAFFASEQGASDAIEALNTQGFQPHQFGAVRGSKPGGGAMAGTMGVHAAEKMWDKVRSFFDVNGGSGQHQSDARVKDPGARGIIAGAYPYDHGDLAYLLKGFSVPGERARYFEHRLSSSPGGVLLTLSAPEREEEAQGILTRHGGDLGGAAADFVVPAKAGYEEDSAQPHAEMLGEVLRVQTQRESREDVPEFRMPLMNEEPSDREIAVRQEIAAGKRSSGGTDGRSAGVHQETLDDLPHEGPAMAKDRENFDARSKAR